ncbi:MAG: 7TM domain-containing protein [Candidatus Shapirobacteria bacterium]
MKKIMIAIALTVAIAGWWRLGLKEIAAEEGNLSGQTLQVLKVEKWNGFNSLRYGITLALNQGVEPSTVVLLLLLPVVATLVSGLHYLIGLSGYGIFMPTMIAVTFLNTGILGGLILFGLILGISALSNWGLKRLKLHFWPGRSISLMFIGLGTFGLMLGSQYFKNVIDLSGISIYSVLLMILLAEEFTRTQLTKSKGEAKKLTLGTLLLAISGAVVMKITWLQETVLLNPELTVLIVVVLNLLIGNYTGMRLTEIKRFGKAIRK